MKHLSLDDIKIAKPNFNSVKKPKGQIISDWLIDWIKHSLEYGIADIGDFIPPKEALAKYLNVSTSTIQNSIRYVKNLGYFASKQSCGTCIADFYSKDIKPEYELSKDTITECKIKKIVIDKNIPLNTPIPDVKELSILSDISKNTIRTALSRLCLCGYLEKTKTKGNKHNWIYKKEFKLTQEEFSNGIQDENFTLTHRLVDKIKTYIQKTYKQGEKILPNAAFCAMFDVSIKTINDAMKTLAAEGFIFPKRGRWGTIYLGEKNSKKEYISSEIKKINPKYIYSWQKALGHLKKYISENYRQGEKIPPIRQLALILNVSPNTIRRALSDLFKSGYLISKRGKHGGIFILDMPEPQGDSYRWLALNQNAIKFD